MTVANGTATDSGTLAGVEVVLVTGMSGAGRSSAARALEDLGWFVVDNLPPQVTLAMTTRADPPLPLSRLRARGELVEVRAADLRFTTDEAEAFLNDVMGAFLP